MALYLLESCFILIEYGIIIIGIWHPYSINMMPYSINMMPYSNNYDAIFQLDVDPQRDDDASSMSAYRCMLRPTWMLI